MGACWVALSSDIGRDLGLVGGGRRGASHAASVLPPLVPSAFPQLRACLDS